MSGAATRGRMGLLERIGHDGTCLQRIHRRVLDQTGTDGFLMRDRAEARHRSNNHGRAPSPATLTGQLMAELVRTAVANRFLPNAFVVRKRTACADLTIPTVYPANHHE